MTTKENNNERNWTLIGCTGLAIIVGAYSFTTIKVASITEQYRNEQIAKYMDVNDTLKKKECDEPIKNAVSEMRTRGINVEGRNEMAVVSPAIQNRCLTAQATIENNNDKMKKAITIKPPFSYVKEKFFN